MKKTTTEKYIEKAVSEAKKELSGTNISHCNFNVNVDTADAAETLANALLVQAEANEAQAEANEANSLAIQSLTEKLKKSNIYAVHVGKDSEA